MVPSITTELDAIQEAFMDGVSDAVDEIPNSVFLDYLDCYDGLSRMAYYDGYIRRKYGLVDEDGKEIFR